MTDKNRVYIFDTTMRDGEQSPGASMSLEEKIQIARVFDELGVDIIEAGFPIASPGDFEAVSEVSKVLKISIPAGVEEGMQLKVSGNGNAAPFEGINGDLIVLIFRLIKSLYN